MKYLRARLWLARLNENVDMVRHDDDSSEGISLPVKVSERGGYDARVMRVGQDVCTHASVDVIVSAAGRALSD